MCFANKEKIFLNKMSRVKSKAQVEVCGDCGASDPSWASINRGILLCAECCSIHRSLGRHISQIKSLRQGTWCPSVLNFVNSINAHGANSVWEHCLLDVSSGNSGSGHHGVIIGSSVSSGNSKQIKPRKPNSKDPLHPIKSDFIKAKHVNLAYVLKPQQQIDDDTNGNIEIELSKQLHASVRTSNLETSLRLIVQGADPNYFHDEKRSTPLHVAAKFGQASQIELLIVYGAEINVVDGNGLTPVEIAKNNKHNVIAERLIEAMYEVTDRISLFLGGKKPNHSSGKHLIIPEQNVPEISEQLKIARGKLQLVPNKMFEELVMDLYDEVDRRENEAIWATSSINPDIGGVPFLPANPYLSATRNQGRQKLARFSPSEFAGLLTDVLIDAKRRQNMANLRPTIQSSGILSTKQQERDLSDDEPLYDAVASDDDYAALTPIAQKAMFNQTSSIYNTNNKNNEVESLRRQLMEYMSEINQLKNVVQKLSTENSELKSKMIDTTNIIPTTTGGTMKNAYNMYDVPLRIDLNGVENEREPLLDGNGNDNSNIDGINDGTNSANNNNNNQLTTTTSTKRPVSMYETRLGPLSKNVPEFRTTTSMYQMAPQLTSAATQQQQQQINENKQQKDIIATTQTPTAVIDYFQPFGEEVKHRTSLVTRRLKELCIAMQDTTTSSSSSSSSAVTTTKDAFITCAERIRIAVVELIAIFSAQNCDETIKGAIKQLNMYTGIIQRECENLQKSLIADNTASIDVCIQKVRDCALQLASATKILVMKFQ